MTARFLINDGQHRRAAIELALKERPELGDETLSVVFLHDAGLKRSQQMFADLIESPFSFIQRAVRIHFHDTGTGDRSERTRLDRNYLPVRKRYRKQEMLEMGWM